MTVDEFRAALAPLGLNQSSFARRLLELGYPASARQVLRRVQRWVDPRTPLPGEAVVIIRLMQENERLGEEDAP